MTGIQYALLIAAAIFPTVALVYYFHQLSIGETRNKIFKDGIKAVMQRLRLMDKPRVRIVMGKHIWLAVAPTGFTMPLEEYYERMQRLARATKNGN